MPQQPDTILLIRTSAQLEDLYLRHAEICKAIVALERIARLRAARMRRRAGRRRKPIAA